MAGVRGPRDNPWKARPPESPPEAREPVSTYFDKKVGHWVKVYAPGYAEIDHRPTALPKRASRRNE